MSDTHFSAPPASRMVLHLTEVEAFLLAEALRASPAAKNFDVAELVGRLASLEVAPATLEFEHDEFGEVDGFFHTDRHKYELDPVLRDTCATCGERLVRRHGALTHETTPADDHHVAATVMPWAEYRSTIGNPNNYWALIATLNRKCGCCNRWYAASSLGGITVYVNPYMDEPILGYCYSIEDAQRRWPDIVEQLLDLERN